MTNLGLVDTRVGLILTHTSITPGNNMRPAYGTQPHVILQSGKRDKLPYIFFISSARFQVGDVRQPFLFGRNIGELLELRGPQAVFFKQDQVHWFILCLNTIIGFIMLEKGIFLKPFKALQTRHYWSVISACLASRVPTQTREMRRSLAKNRIAFRTIGCSRNVPAKMELDLIDNEHAHFELSRRDPGALP